MSSCDVDVDLDDLDEVTGKLNAIIGEFEGLVGATDELQDAIAYPGGRRELRARAGDFEQGWNGNREVYLESLHNIHDHLRTYVDEMRLLDEEMAKEGECQE
jgi:hypothetical protein